MPYSLGDPQYIADSSKGRKDEEEQSKLNKEKTTENEKGELEKDPFDSLLEGY